MKSILKEFTFIKFIQNLEKNLHLLTY